MGSNFYFLDVILLYSGDMVYWKCKVCGNIQEGKTAPDECNICFAGKNSFVKIDDKDVEMIEGTEKKKKYKRIFKKGFDRRLSRKK